MAWQYCVTNIQSLIFSFFDVPESDLSQKVIMTHTIKVTVVR